MAEIKLVKHQERMEELLDLFRVSFGSNMSAELWNWKYLQNPLASIDSEVIVAVDNGKIVGARPFLLAEMWLKSERVKVAQPCDTMVHPEHRRKGIFSRMNQYAIEHLRQKGYAFFYNFPGAMSRPGYLRQGWKIISTTDTLFRIVNPQKLISYKLKNKFLGNSLGFIYDKLLNTGVKASPLSSSFQIKVFDHLAEELKGIDILRDNSAIDLVRSATYLRWRFDRHPEHSYKYVMAKKDGDLWGYAVTSMQKQPSSLVHGMIVDYLVKDEDITCIRALISQCLKELEKSKCDLLSVWSFCQPGFGSELVKHLGLKASSGFPFNRVWEKGYLVAREIDEQVLEKIDIYSKENWQVTFIYPDTT